METRPQMSYSRMEEKYPRGICPCTNTSHPEFPLTLSLY